MANFTDFINGALDLVVPHARKEPLNPMAYVRDINEWFAPAAQMALDEMEGRESYPKWNYMLASIPVLGKAGKFLKNVPEGAIVPKFLENETTKKAAEKIRKLEQENREYYNQIKKTRPEIRFDKYGNPIGDGTWHTNYQVYDIPGTDVSISPSNTSESVYVTYRTPDGKSSTSRHSTHFSNQEDKDFIDILNDLGMIKSVPRYEKKLWGQNVKKSKVDSYPSSGLTYSQILDLPEDEMKKYKGMLIVDENGNKKNWMFNGDSFNNEVGRDYFIKDEFEKLFEGY